MSSSGEEKVDPLHPQNHCWEVSNSIDMSLRLGNNYIQENDLRRVWRVK